MPACCVVCGARRGRNQTHLTFHKFPRNEDLKEKWLEAIGVDKAWSNRKEWHVCSLHFEESCFNRTHETIRLHSESVPSLHLSQIPDVEDENPSEFQVCRLCLVTDVKMHRLMDRNLHLIYRDITGISISNNVFPEMICWECTQRLVSAHQLRCKAIQSHKLLLLLLRTYKKVTMKDIKGVDRNKFKLKSSLCIDHWKEQILMPYDEIKTWTDNDSVFNYNGFNDNEINDGDSNDNNIIVKYNNMILLNGDDTESYFNDTNDNDEDMSDDSINVIEIIDSDSNENDVDTDLDNTNMSTSVNGEEANEIYLEESFERDEDLNCNVIDKDKTADDEVAEDDEAAEDNEAPKNDENETNIVDGAEIPTKNKPNRDNSYEELYTIKTLTIEEQIAEVNRRQESEAYKYAILKCTECFRGFRQKHIYDAHLLRHSEESGAFPCVICKKRLKTKQALRKHTYHLHAKLYSCKECPFVTKVRRVAQTHKEWHEGATYQCAQCHLKFDKITTYHNHMRIKHASEFVCELCGYMFVSQKGVEIHKNFKHSAQSETTVTLEGPYCDVCEVRFVSEEAYQRHVKLSSRHSGNNDKSLRNDSKFRYSSTSSEIRPGLKLKRPWRNPNTLKRTEQPVNCEQCGIKLQGPRAYYFHFKRAHPDKHRSNYPTVTRPSMCETCGRVFQSVSKLRCHRLIHTGEKPFQCSVCGKKFRLKCLLGDHLRVHSDVKLTFPCDICHKRFSSVANVHRHKLVHTGVRRHKCEHCGKSFRQACEKKLHINYVHLKKPWPKRNKLKRRKKMEEAPPDAMTGASETASS